MKNISKDNKLHLLLLVSIRCLCSSSLSFAAENESWVGLVKKNIGDGIATQLRYYMPIAEQKAEVLSPSVVVADSNDAISSARQDMGFVDGLAVCYSTAPEMFKSPVKPKVEPSHVAEKCGVNSAVSSSNIPVPESGLVEKPWYARRGNKVTSLVGLGEKPNKDIGDYYDDNFEKIISQPVPPVHVEKSSVTDNQQPGMPSGHDLTPQQVQGDNLQKPQLNWKQRIGRWAQDQLSKKSLDTASDKDSKVNQQNQDASGNKFVVDDRHKSTTEVLPSLKPNPETLLSRDGVGNEQANAARDEKASMTQSSKLNGISVDSITSPSSPAVDSGASSKNSTLLENLDQSNPGMQVLDNAIPKIEHLQKPLGEDLRQGDAKGLRQDDPNIVAQKQTEAKEASDAQISSADSTLSHTDVQLPVPAPIADTSSNNAEKQIKSKKPWYDFWSSNSSTVEQQPQHAGQKFSLPGDSQVQSERPSDTTVHHEQNNGDIPKQNNETSKPLSDAIVVGQSSQSTVSNSLAVDTATSQPASTEGFIPKIPDIIISPEEQDLLLQKNFVDIDEQEEYYDGHYEKQTKVDEKSKNVGQRLVGWLFGQKPMLPVDIQGKSVQLSDLVVPSEQTESNTNASHDKKEIVAADKNSEGLPAQVPSDETQNPQAGAPKEKDSVAGPLESDSTGGVVDQAQLQESQSVDAEVKATNLEISSTAAQVATVEPVGLSATSWALFGGSIVAAGIIAYKAYMYTKKRTMSGRQIVAAIFTDTGIVELERIYKHILDIVDSGQSGLVAEHASTVSVTLENDTKQYLTTDQIQKVLDVIFVTSLKKQRQLMLAVLVTKFDMDIEDKKEIGSLLRESL